MVQRAEQFSPNAVDKDRAILDAVAERLHRQGHQVSTVSETALAVDDPNRPEWVFSMGRLPETLRRLEALQVPVVNSPEGVSRCARSVLTGIMQQLAIPMPPSEGADGYWLKRGDAAAQEHGDVVYAADRRQLAQCIKEMEERGISNYTVSAHVRGDLVKFYGVRGTGFFRYFYPTDDGQSKFGDEQRNGTAHHYAFDLQQMHSEAERLAGAVGVAVYGGDCIVKADGSFCMIDFNDWPSFSRCREEAADAIASLMNSK